VLVDLLHEIFATDTVEHWVNRFDAKGVAASPLHTIAQAMAHPQVLANEMVVQAVNPDGSKQPLLGAAFKLSGTTGYTTQAAPHLGADTDAVLQSLNYSPAEIARLRNSGAL
jgi:crotonobetainyl-CoA:carnitine CoA-transferase CaiB-like acyl-CoA transferase